MTTTHVAYDPFFADPADADAMVRLCERFGSYGMYSQEDVPSEIGAGMAQRHDVVTNFLRTGGRFARDDDPMSLAARTNYFREEYAYGQDEMIDGIGIFLHHPGFVEGARALFPGRTIVEPAIVFANLMVPGQELAIHTDVGEFRGCNRKVTPQWLIVAMHHSRLFEPWRIPIATGVAWFHDCEGGEFAFYPDGADGPPVAHRVRHNTAMLLDTDSVFHGVDRIAEPSGALAPLKPGMTLDFAGNGTWVVHSSDAEVVRYRWDELRFSVSWKAYCFADEHERATWLAHDDDLGLERVVDVFRRDLHERGLAAPDVATSPDLGRLITETYIRFPASLAA